MSGKIEISRELAERLLNFTCNEEYDELRALLAATVVERQPVAINENYEFEKWWCRTPILRKSRIQVAQEAWEARAHLDKLKELNQ